MNASNDTTFSDAQRQSASWLMAFSDVVTGRPGRHLDLNRSLRVVIGPRADILHLMGWAGWVRRTGVPIAVVSPGDKADPVPQISLVCSVGNQTPVFENCLLWQRRDGAAAHLIPDDFGRGAFSVGPDLAVRHHHRPPTPNVRAAGDGAKRAYGRLLEAVADHLKGDQELDMPVRMKRMAA